MSNPSANHGTQPVNHPVYGAVRAHATELRGGPDAEVWQTLALMRRYAVEDQHTEPVRGLAGHCQRQAYYHGGNQVAQCKALYEWIRENLRFANDEPLGEAVGWQIGLGSGDVVEVLVRPVDMVLLPANARVGDCDDYSMLAASVLLALGIPCEFEVVAADARDYARFSHVYVVAYPAGNDGKPFRVAMDCSHGPHFGWEAPADKVRRRASYPLAQRDGGLERGALLLLLGGLGWLAYSQWKN